MQLFVFKDIGSMYFKSSNFCVSVKYTIITTTLYFTNVKYSKKFSNVAK